MKLLEDWKHIAKKAWSFRLGVLAAVFSGLEFILPYLADSFPKNVFAAISFLVVIFACISRLVAQPRMTDGK